MRYSPVSPLSHSPRLGFCIEFSITQSKPMSIYLGIDIGTSGTKTLAIDAKGKILAEAMASYPCYHPKPLWSEQDPEDWWQATVKTVRPVVKKAKLKPADVRAIGLSGQMHGSVFLDKKNRVIRRALLWNDQRTAAECEEIEKRAGGRKQLIEMVANPALTGFTAPKILWLRNHEPKNFEKTVKVLLPKDDVRRRLTGEFATEVSDASGMLLLDVVQRRWSKELLGKLELDPSLFAPCYESEEVTGKLTPEVAKELGLTTDCVVVGGAGDCAAGAVGNGIVKPGCLSTSIGTSGVMFVHSETPQVDPEGRLHTFCHAVRGKWHMMGVTLSAGGSLQWFRNALCQTMAAAAKRQKIDVYDVLTRRSGRHAARRRRAVLPAVSLRRTHAARRSESPAARSSASRSAHARAPGAVDHGRRDVFAARQPGDHRRARRAGEANSRLRRRGAEPVLATNSGRRLRPDGRHDHRRRRARLRRRAAGGRRRGRVQGRRRSVRGDREDQGPNETGARVGSCMTRRFRCIRSFIDRCEMTLRRSRSWGRFRSFTEQRIKSALGGGDAPARLGCALCGRWLPFARQ